MTGVIMREMRTAGIIMAIMLGVVCSGRADEGVTNAQETVLAQTTNGNFVLYVSNQSFDLSPVDITVSIDGKKAVSADFVVGTAHSWVAHRFQLTPGVHKITATSEKGAIQLEKEIEITHNHWAAIGFVFSTKNDRKQFLFRIQATPLSFM